MKIVMTLMVRDEADIVGPMISHHLEQGVDTIIVTDNGSIDGTREVLEEFAADGRIELHHDPVHRKQQSTRVTEMARRAASVHGADWVVNADADEFWVPIDRSSTLSRSLSSVPTGLGAFTVKVNDMTGPPAASGSGLQRLVYRDNRPVERLREIGLIAHSTDDVVHVGDAAVSVVQGNHTVDIATNGEPDARFSVEVLHFPWRSWAQYSRKVENAGRAYEESDLTPSPNHHGMRDYRRLRAGSLLSLYVARHPDADELRRGLESGELVKDTTIAERFRGPHEDVPLDDAVLDAVRPLGEVIGRLEEDARWGAHVTATQAHEIKLLEEKTGHLEYRVRELEAQLTATAAELDTVRSRRIVRVTDRIGNVVRRR